MILPRLVVRKVAKDFSVTRSLRREFGSTTLWKDTDGCLRHRSGGPHSANAVVTTDSSSNYFSLASKHFNTTSANELVLFSRFRANLSSPCSVLLPASPPPSLSRPVSFQFPSAPFFDAYRSQPDYPLNTDLRSPHYFNCASSNNSQR